MHYYEKQKEVIRKKYIKLLGGFFILLGIFSILYFFLPIISYQIFLVSAYEQDNIEIPIPRDLMADKSANDLGSLVASGLSLFTTDFSDARNWYPDLPESQEKDITAKSEDRNIDSYSLSIPKLKIEDADVSTVDYDLGEHLVQYFGTALPGLPGTAVVFGHSTIPSWFDPGDYKTIFATLHTIKVGDEIVVKVKDKTLKYKVFSILITKPEDVNILSQSYDNSYLTLVTCTPPGTIWKRLIVRAALEQEGV